MVAAPSPLGYCGISSSPASVPTAAPQPPTASEQLPVTQNSPHLPPGPTPTPLAALLCLPGSSVLHPGPAILELLRGARCCLRQTGSRVLRTHLNTLSTAQDHTPKLLAKKKPQCFGTLLQLGDPRKIGLGSSPGSAMPPCSNTTSYDLWTQCPEIHHFNLSRQNWALLFSQALPQTPPPPHTHTSQEQGHGTPAGQGLCPPERHSPSTPPRLCPLPPTSKFLENDAPFVLVSLHPSTHSSIHSIRAPTPNVASFVFGERHQ